MLLRFSLILTITATAPPTVERQRFLMGTEVRATVSTTDREAGLRALDRTLDAVARADDLLSTWRSGTPLAQLNQAPEGTHACEPRLAEILERVLDLARQTFGAFDPTIGALVESWDLRGQGRLPAPSADVVPLGWWHVRVSGNTIEKTLPVTLDAGGFGKGVAASWAIRAIEDAQLGPGLVDLGGQLGLAGRHELGIASPSDRSREVAVLTVEGGSVATSGQSERWVEIDGTRYGHILDPRTGRPVPAWGSVTVWAKDPVLADVLATALFVLGPEAALPAASAWPEVAVMLLVDEPDGLRALVNSAMDRRLRWVEAPIGCGVQTWSRSGS